MSSTRSTRWLSYLRAMTTELIVVFVGVYGAFWVENHRERKAQEDNAEKMALALQQDLLDYAAVTHGFIDHIDSGLAEWDAARSRRESPAPFVFRIYGAEIPPVATWDAVRQAAAAELLEPNLLFELGFFYNEITGMPTGTYATPSSPRRRSCPDSRPEEKASTHREPRNSCRSSRPTWIDCVSTGDS